MASCKQSQSQWDKLSPNEFQQLQDLASYSSKKLEDVLEEFCGSTSATCKFSQDDDIDFEGFQKFINLFLDCETPLDLSQHLFLSFLRPYQSQLSGNSTLSCMAAVSSNAACVPVISHNTRGI
ncbi:hypothetical protein PVAND_008318 [Polypedilum vanderplanki]|uniref:Diacylglycerol kinase type I N-terminal domain-containing protein n=1 Tax=Polypedilum vanderplanki TaxID=319348 RepID=A0A9J6C993_POLVA|nr:hypothetical protein PVAND_008318 [Polypedilum vanderplanki]